MQGMIYLLHKYYCRKILTRHMDVVKVEIGGGCLDPDVLSQVFLIFCYLLKSFREHEIKVFCFSIICSKFYQYSLRGDSAEHRTRIPELESLKKLPQRYPANFS